MVAQTTQKAYLYGGADIYRLVVNNEKGVVFGADSKVKYSNSRELYTLNDAEVSIENPEW